jgi:hypothetical protein
MTQYFQTVVPQHLLVTNADSSGLQIGNEKFARRAKFVPVPDDATSLWAEVSAPPEANLYGISVLLNGVAPVGKLHVSTVNPTFSYSGFFLYGLLNPIEVATVTPTIKMFRNLEMHGYGYNTNLFTAGKLYLVITNAPAIPAQADGILADIMVITGNG